MFLSQQCFLQLSFIIQKPWQNTEGGKTRMGCCFWSNCKNFNISPPFLSPSDDSMKHSVPSRNPFLMTKNKLIWQFCGGAPASVICLSSLHWTCVRRQSCSPQPWHPRLWRMLVLAVCVGIVTLGCQKRVAWCTHEHLLTRQRASVKMKHAGGDRVSGRREPESSFTPG